MRRPLTPPKDVPTPSSRAAQPTPRSAHESPPARPVPRGVVAPLAAAGAPANEPARFTSTPSSATASAKESRLAPPPAASMFEIVKVASVSSASFSAIWSWLRWGQW